MTRAASPLSVAVVGAGPVGLALALHAARTLPEARVTLFDARPAHVDISADARALALSLGSVHLLQRLGAWPAAAAQPIAEVHVSQQPPTLAGLASALLGEPEVRIRAVDEAVPMLGAVLRYGEIVAPLQAAWMAEVAAEPHRLAARFGTPVAATKSLAGGVEVDAGIAERFDLAVLAEGSVLARAERGRAPLRHDYRQTAWVGTVTLEGGRAGVAYERFTRHGPAALLPLKDGRAALVWCVRSDDDPVAELDDAQRLAVLATLFHPEAGRPVALSPLKRFPLALSAERTLTEGRTVRIGNAAQTLHPVAGQGLNLGLRDAFELVEALRSETGGPPGRSQGPESPPGGQERYPATWGPTEVDAALRRLERRRAPDRWAMIGATDFLARSFTWRLPGAGAARGLGLAAMQLLGPGKSLLARHMMFGRR